MRAGTVLAAALGVLALSLAAAAAMTGPRDSELATRAPPARPQRIMSTNLCSDLLLLMLVEKERIASITYIARDAVAVLMPGADAGVASNRGTVEEVVRQRPDLILASPWSTPVVRRVAAKAGVPVVEIPSANSFADIRLVTRQVGAAVGEPARAEALIRQMDRTLAELERRRPARPVRVVAWGPGNSVPARGTLTDEILHVAGAVNLATEVSADSAATFGLEELMLAQPDAVLRASTDPAAPTLQDAIGEHPMIRRAFKGRRITYPVFLHTCGLPQSARSALQLAEALAALPAREAR